jgi:hypothetical protein
MIGKGRAMEPALALLAELCRPGVELATEDDRLRYRPREAVTPTLVEGLKANKPALLVILAARQAGQLSDLAEQWPEDWRDRWGERSAIMEYDGGLPREVAEDRAFLDLLSYMDGPE